MDHTGPHDKSHPGQLRYIPQRATRCCDYVCPFSGLQRADRLCQAEHLGCVYCGDLYCKTFRYSTFHVLDKVPGIVAMRKISRVGRQCNLANAGTVSPLDREWSHFDIE